MRERWQSGNALDLESKAPVASSPVAGPIPALSASLKQSTHEWTNSLSLRLIIDHRNMGRFGQGGPPVL